MNRPLLSITAEMPGGSIDVVGVADAGDGYDVDLRLKRDPGPDVLAIGYYLFRATGPRGVARRFRIRGVRDDAKDRLAGREGYEDGWTGTGPHVSYDRVHWTRIPGRIEGGDYVFEHVPEREVAYYARWAHYGVEREYDCVAAAAAAGARVDVLGRTVQGREIQRLYWTSADGAIPAPERLQVWLIARQHPSETMASWFVEGLLARLGDPGCAIARALLEKAVFHVVPNMNPDGAVLGHTRANAAGANLNREWVEPSLATSPEVFHVRAEMERTGVDFAMDCHGDEELRCNFLGGPLEIPSRSPALADLFAGFEHAWHAVTPEYELGHPYPGGPPATADLRMAWNWIAERFHCLSVLLEQPFKDTSWRTEPATGWSPERSLRFGTSLPPALLAIADRLDAWPAKS